MPLLSTHLPPLHWALSGAGIAAVTRCSSGFACSACNRIHASGDSCCANCHAGFMVGDFAKLVKPPNHIPTAQVPCINCHVLTDMTIMAPLSTIHRIEAAQTSGWYCMASRAK